MTGAPTSGHTARYSPANVESAPDGRLFSRVVARNSPPVIAALAPWLASASGTALEIGSGTGQHAANFALAIPRLAWQASDPDAGHRASAAAWAAHLGLSLPAPLDLDAAADWAAAPEVTALGPLAAVIAMNVIHIAPVAVLHGILAGAGKALAPGGLLILYGPMTEPGVQTGPGNAAFDANLRAENADWGLRDTAEIREKAAPHGLDFAALIAMPANNRLLILRRA
ncbi:DUF938 domain-containing protein [Oceaniglobus roseus]|uniref:DUF938 domain-containing protein n=1 Tax=Oceaniglobus roseus TaxID=1737570 RepID=UPI000C7EB06A|nr:DUF938 domain-containing protein [Kandeliimicrobium roseum]